MTTQVVCSHDIACLCKIKSNRITDNMNLLSLWVTHQRDVIKHFRTSECRDGHWTLTEQNVARARVCVCVCVCVCVYVCVLCAYACGCARPLCGQGIIYSSFHVIIGVRILNMVVLLTLRDFTVSTTEPV